MIATCLSLHGHIDKVWDNSKDCSVAQLSLYKARPTAAGYTPRRYEETERGHTRARSYRRSNLETNFKAKSAITYFVLKHSHYGSKSSCRVQNAVSL